MGVVRLADDHCPWRIPTDWSRQLMVEVHIIEMVTGFR
jgi:hypothetical protein